MKWNLPLPKDKEYRHVYKFAWVPVKCNDCSVWLEKYLEIQIYNLSIKKWITKDKLALEDENVSY